LTGRKTAGPVSQLVRGVLRMRYVVGS